MPVSETDAIEVLRDLVDVSTDVAFSVEALGVEQLRACHALLTTWAPLIADALRKHDEQELAEARARVADIERRLSVAPLPQTRPESPPSPPLSDYAQTDAGMGISGGREPAQDAQDFRDELHELRERGLEKRRRRGA